MDDALSTTNTPVVGLYVSPVATELVEVWTKCRV